MDGCFENAMRSIDASGTEIALVVDGDDVLLGDITDCDITRGLLNGGSLQPPIDWFIRRDFFSMTMAAGRAEVQDMMQARVLKQIRVVVIHGNVQQREIEDAIDSFQGKRFFDEIKNARNPYGKPGASRKSVEIIKNFDLKNILKNEFVNVDVCAKSASSGIS